MGLSWARFELEGLQEGSQIQPNALFLGVLPVSHQRPLDPVGGDGGIRTSIPTLSECVVLITIMFCLHPVSKVRRERWVEILSLQVSTIPRHK